MTNDMRKLMETVEKFSAVDLLDEYKGKTINEGWDVKGIAQAIHDEIVDNGSPISKAFNDSNEPYRASIYEFGRLSGLYNAEAIDGSEIYHKILDELELLVAGPEERFMGEDEDDGDVESKHRSDEEFYQDLKNLTDEAFDAIASDFMNPAEQLDEVAQVLQDIDNMVTLRASGKPYAPIHEDAGQECQWWAMCDNPATTTEPHPVLGDVPICDRCVAKLRKIEGLG